MSFRLANEGLPSINYMLGEVRRLNICREDLIILLNNTDPTKPPLLNTLTEETQNNVKDLGKQKKTFSVCEIFYINFLLSS